MNQDAQKGDQGECGPTLPAKFQGRVMGRAIAAIQGATQTAFWRPFDGIAGILAGFWQEMIRDAVRPYRPEKHYMRGPGPAWQAKYGNLPRA
jgi:hypothetical protein